MLATRNVFCLLCIEDEQAPCSHAHMWVYAYKCTHTHTHTRTHTHTHIYIHTHTHTRMHKRTQVVAAQPVAAPPPPKPTLSAWVPAMVVLLTLLVVGLVLTVVCKGGHAIVEVTQVRACVCCLSYRRLPWWCCSHC